MAESYCVELAKPSSNAYGWFVPALRTENAVRYYLSVDGTVEPDDVEEPFKVFYFATEKMAYSVMKQYYEDWNEPFPFLNEEVVQLNESQKMKFI